MLLVKPALEHLPSYIAALERGWSPDNLRPEASVEELCEIRLSPVAFVARLEDREAKGAPIKLPDGTTVPRLPGFRRFMWDGEFCGSIGLRWHPGTPVLPETCLGHVGYAVVPWKRGRGYATQALAQILPEATRIGLPYVELTTEPDNLASQRVILANGGVFVESFTAPRFHGAHETLRYRIPL